MANTDHHFDAIVIGAGMSGAWAAKEFSENGFKTLLLERGRDVKHIKDYPTTNMQPWEFPNRGRVPHKVREQNPVISRCYAFREDTTHFFVKDTDHSYEQVKPFDWIRGYQVGGKSIMWARQVQRWSDYDFEGPARDGFAVDWPIRYQDLAPWYSYVERYVGVSGNKDGIATVPDGEFLKAWDLNCVEQYFQQVVKDNFKNRHVIYGRCAHISELTDELRAQGRTLCQSRVICERGCPYGGYFNVNTSVIPAALNSGNCTLRPHSLVHSIIYDASTQKASGVRVIDTQTGESTEYFAKVVFVNAATINTNALLLNSRSERFPDGLGNDSGTLGKYVAFHNYRARISARHEGHQEFATEGKRPTSAYIPRFRNVERQETDFLRGYAAGFNARRSKSFDSSGFGADLKNNLLNSVGYGDWRVGSHMMGETIPKASNFVALDDNKLDEHGMPRIQVSIDYDDNDEQMIQDYFEQMTYMFEKAGFTDIQASDSKQAPGLDIHEMGGVRMGKDPRTSMLNQWNQMHACPNVFVTDGACMTSVSTQNPSLTFMALAVRAAHHAMDELKKGNL